MSMQVHSKTIIIKYNCTIYISDVICIFGYRISETNFSRYIENNLFEDDENDEKREVFHEEVILIETHRDALIEIKNRYQFNID